MTIYEQVELAGIAVLDQRAKGWWMVASVLQEEHGKGLV